MDLNEIALPALSSPGEVISFYSYKGGAGRSMALANLAQRLAGAADAALPILMIDWDLEGPSLHHYFNCKLDGPGLLELFQSCQDSLVRWRGAPPRDPEALARALLEQLPWEQYLCRTEHGGALYLLRAGCHDDSYGERLAGLRWAELFRQCPALFRCLAQKLSQHFRYVLIDARAGRHETTGICTALLPEKLVLVFAPERFGVDGVLGVAARAASYRRSDEDDHRPLLMFPLPSRVDAADGRQRAQWRRGVDGYQPGFERLFAEHYGVQPLSLDSYFDEVQLQEIRRPDGGSPLAVCHEQGGDRLSLTRSIDTLRNWLEGPYFPWQSRRELELLRAIGEERHAGGDGVAQPGWPSLARALERLGAIYRAQGRGRQALTSLQESLDLRRRYLGDEHPDTLRSKSELALALRLSAEQAAARQAREPLAEAPLPPGEATGLHELQQGSSAEQYHQAVRPVLGSGAVRPGLHVVADADLLTLDGARHGPR